MVTHTYAWVAQPIVLHYDLIFWSGDLDACYNMLCCTGIKTVKMHNILQTLVILTIMAYTDDRFVPLIVYGNFLEVLVTNL